MSEDPKPKFDLGERVPVGGVGMPLPHPQGFDPWADGESPDAPFSSEQATGTASGGQTQSRTPQDVPKETKEEAPASVHTGKRPVPPPSKPTRKETKLLKKFRETFGLKRVDTPEATVTRRNPHNPDEPITMTFGFRGLGYEDYQFVVAKAYELTQNPQFSSFGWMLAVCSMGVAHIDGTPIWEALGFDPEKPEDVKDPMYPHLGLRILAAEAFLEELQSSFFDLVEELYKAYEREVDEGYYYKPKEQKETPLEEDSVPFPQTESSS